MAEQVVVPFTSARSQPATEARSTLLTTSVQAMRAHGHFARYEQALDKELKETILTAVAGMWLPLEVAMAHYAACDSLKLSSQEELAIGREVGERVQGTLLGLLVRTAKTAGLTPWAGLSHATKLWERLFQGGSVQVIKLGPKEARLEMVNNRLFSIAYFRNAFRGLTYGGAELFCEKAYVHELPKLTNDTTLGLRVSWA